MRNKEKLLPVDFIPGKISNNFSNLKISQPLACLQFDEYGSTAKKINVFSHHYRIIQHNKSFVCGFSLINCCGNYLC